MNIFNLPDLGEGLPDAEISEWHVKVGDEVKVDQPLVSMETAKAVVEVPAPEAGIIAHLYGQEGDVIKTGAPLVAFKTEQKRNDAATVVGNLASSDETTEDTFIVGGNNLRQTTRVKATPKVKALARQLNVDLTTLQGSGSNGTITQEDVQAAAHPLESGFEQLKGVRKHMVQTMVQSHAEVVPVSIFDDANISAWAENEDITVRLIQALCQAAKAEPALNAWYNGLHNAIKPFEDVHLGLATDTSEGLFVPVIKQANQLTAAQLREKINCFKHAVANRDISPKELSGATLTLSNFGKFAGRYASPIIVPPCVAILGVGRLRKEVVNYQGAPAVHPVLPLSLSFDHRAVTGGEATRFLGHVIQALEKTTHV